MAEMNTTPLIDAMLLLIMFVITIPVPTHSVDIDLPSDCVDGPTTDAARNRLVIDAADMILWNGEPVRGGELAASLAQTTLLPIKPELHFEPEAHASYAISARTMNLIKTAGTRRFGFVGNER